MSNNLSYFIGIRETTAGLLFDSMAFLPEIVLCIGIIVILLLRLVKASSRAHSGTIALFFMLSALAITIAQWTGYKGFVKPDNLAKPADVMFGGLLVYDYMTLFLRAFLFGFSALVIWLTFLTGIPDQDDSADFHTLLIGAVIGMSLMASANHLLMVFIGIEMASLPSYALAGFLKGRRQSSEAALKYVIYGGGAAGVMLYGISLLAGTFGTGYLPDLALAIASRVVGDAGHIVFDPIVLMGLFFLLIGLAFKLAAVPFHFWCPDVFEGASAEVAGFLSVASKGAALALLARLTLQFAGLDAVTGWRLADHWEVLRDAIVPVIGILGAITATFGNLAAYVQTNLKRLLAYSTIAHAGYMMLGLAPLTPAGTSAVLFYLVAYLFMNLGAFAVVAFLRREVGSEDLHEYRGLIRRSPWMVITLSVFLLSLLGIPPLVGFAAKFQIFSVLYDAGNTYYESHRNGMGAFMYALLVIGGVNTVLSAVYYIKVMKVMIIEGRVEDVEGREPSALRERPLSVLYAASMALAVIVLGIVVNPVISASETGAGRFQRLASTPRDVWLKMDR